MAKDKDSAGDDIYLNHVYKQIADRSPGADEPGADDRAELSDLRHLMFASRKATADPKMPGARRLNAALRKVVAGRFVQARELNGMSQTEASERMGYEKSTQLSLWEHGVRLPPIDRMIVAALVYGVSLDYLYGLSDEPERDQHDAVRRALARNMEDQLRSHADRIAASMLAFSKHGGMNVMTVKSLVVRASEAAKAVRRFSELNAKKFDNMPGGATVLHACVALEALVREATTMVQRAEGIAEQAIVTAERRANQSHPLFDSPQQHRQLQIGGL